ncbi:PLP-dependent aminotransferase family protein [Marinobacter sp. JSM 1782161]|uniref:aminotransferase-like domain-containing protein n=1 Tax=Marinobacter sp. JSM 1782161 TaxID=2685906 RepID=UPI00140417F5|nr:PLP-dependent aminotransferase family protein [Marinobacter sp. JSM 1782161]
MRKAPYHYEALETWLLEQIRAGRWRPGDRLPSIRALCAQQGRSKVTVLHALHRLEARGVVEAYPKAGYFVTTTPDDAPPRPQAAGQISAPLPVTVSDLFLDIMRRSAAFDLLPDAPSGEPPPGIVALNRAIGRALRRQRDGQFQYYDEPMGHLSLREQLASQAARRGWRVSPDRLCITSGCQHALFLALMATCRAGDVVAVESPGFYGVLQLLEQLDLRVVEVPTSPETGMDMAALAEVLERWPVRACVVSPAFATPGGALMPDAARRQLLDLAGRHDLAVIEDDIYAETGFAQVPDPLKALDRDDRVILCGSFSKSLSRDLRLGWISGARWHRQILHLKLVTQLASSRYLQQGVAEFMEDGGYAAHLRRQRGLLRERRDRLLSMLRDWRVPVRMTQPQGGLAVWLELPEGVDTLTAYSKALQEGIVLTPGSLFSAVGAFSNGLRISFAHAWDEERRTALGRLPALLELV